MLKIHKGLKKKKKDKKHKRENDDDLFDEAELERYRKEHQRPLDHSDSDKRNTDDPSNENDRSNSNVSSARNDDEWKKFQALTAGVDSILQKTQEDLDRIKSTSFFQRKPVSSSSTGLAANQNEDNNTAGTEVLDGAEQQVTAKKSTVRSPIHVEADEWENDNGTTEKSILRKKLLDTEKRKKGKELEFDNLEKQFTDTEHVSDDESDEVGNDINEEDDSIFNTSYVEAATSGDLKLAYIPDSPTEEVDNDYDPFDTSIADKFIISNPKKRYLNLGCAVEVLSGQIEKSKVATTVVPKSTKRRIVKPVELLLSSFDETEGAESVKFESIEDKGISSVPTIESPVKSLLDEDVAFTPAEPCYPLSTTLYPPVKIPESNATAKNLEINCAPSISPLQSTFAEVLLKNNSVDSADDEFAQLAAESLAKNPTPAESASLPAISNSTDFKFSTPEAEPYDTSVIAQLVSAAAEDQLQKPFSNQVPQTAALLDAIEDDDFDPRATLTSENCGEHLVSHHTSEVFENESPTSQQFNEILSPITFDEDTAFEDDIDPFDTSYVNGLPGKTELKLIEKELIDSE